MTATNETNWVEEIGKPAYESIAEMVAALELDWGRLEELREEKANWEPEEAKGEEHAAKLDAADETWASQNPDDAEELAELEAAAKPCGNSCDDREYAERMIHEDALSVEVRSGWVTPGEDTMTPEDFAILLTTGGPAVRIRGELDDHGEPHRAWLEVQDWGKPWTEYYAGSDSQDVLLAYARCFCFSS